MGLGLGCCATGISARGVPSAGLGLALGLGLGFGWLDVKPPRGERKAEKSAPTLVERGDANSTLSGDVEAPGWAPGCGRSGAELPIPPSLHGATLLGEWACSERCRLWCSLPVAIESKSPAPALAEPPPPRPR